MVDNEVINFSYDYYNNMPSYVRYGLNLLPENDSLKVKKEVIKEIYNFILSMYSKEKIAEICTLSLLFEGRISKLPENEKEKVAEMLFDHVNKIIFNFYDRKELFNNMNESIKMFTGYYGLFGKEREIDNYNFDIPKMVK